MQELVGARLERELHRLAEVEARLVLLFAPVRDRRQRAEHARAVFSARAGDVERLAQDPLGVGVVARGGERLAELAAEDEHGAHGIVELAAEKLAARELEAAAERRHG